MSNDKKEGALAEMREERLIASTLSIMTLFSLPSCLSPLGARRLEEKEQANVHPETDVGPRKKSVPYV